MLSRQTSSDVVNILGITNDHSSPQHRQNYENRSGGKTGRFGSGKGKMIAMSKRGKGKGKGKVVQQEEEEEEEGAKDLESDSHGAEDDSIDAPVRAIVTNGVVKVMFKGAVSISREMLHKRRGEEHFAYMLRNLGTYSKGGSHSQSAESRESKRRRS
jgi:hypothetical protein